GVGRVRSVLGPESVDGNVIAWPQRFLPRSAPKQGIGAAGFDGPSHHGAIRALCIQVDPGMWVHEVELDHGAVQLYGLLVVKLGCKRMMRCQGQHATHRATHKKNQNTDSHYPPPCTQIRSVTSHANTQACATNTIRLSAASQAGIIDRHARNAVRNQRGLQMILRMCVVLLLAGIPALANLNGRWSTGGA